MLTAVWCSSMRFTHVTICIGQQKSEPRNQSLASILYHLCKSVKKLINLLLFYKRPICKQTDIVSRSGMFYPSVNSVIIITLKYRERTVYFQVVDQKREDVEKWGGEKAI